MPGRTTITGLYLCHTTRQKSVYVRRSWAEKERSECVRMVCMCHYGRNIEHKSTRHTRHSRVMIPRPPPETSANVSEWDCPQTHAACRSVQSHTHTHTHTPLRLEQIQNTETSLLFQHLLTPTNSNVIVTCSFHSFSSRVQNLFQSSLASQLPLNPV